MTKRQLDSKYRDLADWVKQIKHSDGTSHSLAFILSYIYNFCNEGKISDILNDLNEDLTLISSNDLIPIITDIYNDNYELTEPKHYWKFNAMNFMSYPIKAYAGKIANRIELVTNNDTYMEYYCTKSKLIKSLAASDTSLTIDNFTPVEEIEND